MQGFAPDAGARAGTSFSDERIKPMDLVYFDQQLAGPRLGITVIDHVDAHLKRLSGLGPTNALPLRIEEGDDPHGQVRLGHIYCQNYLFCSFASTRTSSSDFDIFSSCNWSSIY
jgi:hypothetical protein